jgi:hypothetical protein
MEMAGGLDALPTAAFQSMVDADDDEGQPRFKDRNQQPQQGPAQRQARPDIAVEQAVKGGEPGMFRQTEGAQAVGDRAWPDRQQRANRQGCGGVATALAEGRKERGHPGNEGLRKVQVGAGHNRSPATTRCPRLKQSGAREDRCVLD